MRRILITVALTLLCFSARQLFADKYTPIKIGMIGILSGAYSSVGISIAEGAKVAAEEHNRTSTQKIQLILEDDGFDAKKGVSAYKKLVSVDKVSGLNDTSSPTIDAIYPEVSKTNLHVIQFGEQGVSPSNDNVFQIPPALIESANEIGRYVKIHKDESPYIVTASLGAFERMVRAIKAEADREIPVLELGGDETNYKAVALKVRAANPSLIVVMLPASHTASFVKEMKMDSRSFTYLFDASLLANLKDLRALLGDLSFLHSDLIAAIRYYPTKKFRDTFRAARGTNPAYLADIGYDSVNILLKTYSPNALQWLENLRAVKLDGAAGPIQFNSDGARMTNADVISVQKAIELHEGYFN